MRAISHVSAVFHAWNVNTAESLAALKKEQNLNIAPYVTFTAARAVCHLQCDIVDTMRVISQNGSNERLPIGITSRAAQSYDAMRALGLLDRLPDEDTELWQDLLEHLRLGLVSSLPELHEEQRWQNVLYDSFNKGESHLKQLPPDDRRALENFELRMSAFKTVPPHPVPLHLKLIVNRGHAAALVRVLHAFVDLPSLTSADEIDFALETLNFVTSGLSARFCSALIQRHLVQLIGNLLRMVYPPDPLNLTHNMRRSSNVAFFNVLGTLGDPAAISDAKQVLAWYLDEVEIDSVASQVLCKVNTMSFRFVGIIIFTVVYGS